MFVSRVSQTRENKRGVKVSMLSSRLLDDVFVSRVSQTRYNILGVKDSTRGEHATLYTTLIVSGLTHTGHEHII
jgi:hypothetical protein